MSQRSGSSRRGDIAAMCKERNTSSPAHPRARHHMVKRLKMAQAYKSPSSLRRILIVDDEEEMALILQLALKTLPDCEVVIVASAEQALPLLEQKPFDMVITDYNMPGMDGVTLATRIRQLFPLIAVVMVTAYRSDALFKLAADASLQRVLSKPVNLTELCSLVMQILGR